MKLIIDIPEEDYKFIKDLKGLILGSRGNCKTIQMHVINAIQTSIPYEERPQGEWKRHDEWRNGEYIGGFYHVNCPCEDGYYSKWETKFCPNCGADMQDPETEYRQKWGILE